MFLSVDGTFWIQLINFAIFFALLNVVFLRPVGAAIKKRRAHIDSVQADYERYSGQVRELRTQGSQKRGLARREAEELVAGARAAAETEAARAVESKAAEAQAIVDEARATVANEMRAAKSRESELSLQLARTLLARATGAGR